MKANYPKTTAKRQRLKPCLHVKHTCRLAAAAPRHFYGAAPARPPAAPTRDQLKRGAPQPRPATPSSPAGRPVQLRPMPKRRRAPRPRSARRRPGPTPRRGPLAREPRLPVRRLHLKQRRGARTPLRPPAIRRPRASGPSPSGRRRAGRRRPPELVEHLKLLFVVSHGPHLSLVLTRRRWPRGRLHVKGAPTARLVTVRAPLLLLPEGPLPRHSSITKRGSHLFQRRPLSKSS